MSKSRRTASRGVSRADGNRLVWPLALAVIDFCRAFRIRRSSSMWSERIDHGLSQTWNRSPSEAVTWGDMTLTRCPPTAGCIMIAPCSHSFAPLCSPISRRDFLLHHGRRIWGLGAGVPASPV